MSAISKQLFTLVGFAYVDDCDLLQVGKDPLDVMSSIQALINSWGTFMEVTGGAIRTDKSWWYLIDYVWKRGKWVASDPDVNLDLVANDVNGTRVSLSRLRCDEAAQMLGVWIAPSEDNTKIVQSLKKDALQWGGKVRHSHSTPEEAWTALHCNISAKLKYPLAACTLTETECKSIMFPAIKAALPRAKMASNLTTAFRDGPVGSLGGGPLNVPLHGHFSN